MLHLLRITPLLCLALLAACAPKPPADPLAGLLARIPALALPFDVQLNGDTDIARHTAETADSALFAAGTRLIGWTRPADGVVAVYYAALGADYTLPAVRTFVDGKQVADQVIGLGACGGGDCGFTCEERFQVQEKGRFICTAKIEVFACDDAGNPTPTRREAYSNVNAGVVQASGQVQLDAKDSVKGDQ